jgi:hypothetical protein
MTHLSPRDIHVAAVVGGGLIGLILGAIGALDFVAAFGGGSSAATSLLEGAVLVSVGAAFLLVSVIVLPALRALAMELAHRE